MGGSVTFAPGSASFDTEDENAFPGAVKSLLSSLSAVQGISGKFRFTEYQTTPNELTSYTATFNNVDVSESVAIGLFGDGGVVFQVGPPDAASNYLGTWVPNGGTHDVFFTIDSEGVPAIWVDGISIPLAFSGTGASSGSFFPGDTLALFFGGASPTPGTSPVTEFFIASGILPPTTVFCCPGA